MTTFRLPPGLPPGLFAVLILAGAATAVQPLLSPASQRWLMVILVGVLWLMVRRVDSPYGAGLDAVFLAVTAFAMLLAVMTTAGLL